MAALSLFGHCRPRPPPPIPYSFTRTAVRHGTQRRNAGFPHSSPVSRRPHTTLFHTETGPSAPLVGDRAGRPSLTAFAGFGSVEQTTLQALATIDVVSLLRAWWIAVTLPILTAPKITAFRELTLILCARGKTVESSSKILNVPQKFFSHFYIVGAIWNSFLLVATWLYAYETAPIQHEYTVWTSVFLLLLMEAQVLRRLFESIFVFNYGPSAQMHVAAYLGSLFYYIAAPLSLCCTYSLEVFKFVGHLMLDKGMQVEGFELLGCVAPLMQLNWCTWTGAAVFFWGWVHQCRCHAILGSLRGNNRKVDDYVIPQGDWFEYVSSPHYLAEIVIYAGILIASGLSDITIWLIFGFVVANLTFAAVETHKWYLGKFNKYPPSRRAIIPFFY